MKAPSPSHIYGSTAHWSFAIREGNPQIFEQLYLDHRQAFLFWAKERFDLGEEELLDVYQYAVVALYENVMSGKVEQVQSSLKTYLFGIAKNLMLNRHRHERVKRAHEEVLREHLVFQLAESESKEGKLEQVALTVLRKLGNPCKSILTWFYFDNLSMADIAQKLGYRSSDVSKSQKRRCIKFVQKQMIQFTQNGGAH